MKLKKKIKSHKIEEAIADFEQHVDFEFLPVIAKKSSYVEHIGWVLSLLFLILFIGMIDFTFATYLHDSYMSSMPYYIASPFLAVLCGALLDKSDWVDRFFIAKPERNRQVQERAERIFYKHQLHQLKSPNALLLYISVMERQIVLYHDPRIEFDRMLQIDQELLKILQVSFKNNDFEEGLLKAIAHLKASLIPQFGYGQSGRNTKKLENSVPNKLIWWNE